MKGTNLGELEEIVLLIVGILFDDAYGVAIQEELEKRCDRKATLSTIHVALHRLDEKGFLESRLDGRYERKGRPEKAIVSRNESWTKGPCECP
ncbi:MAG: PadR family transcriptional regulator [Bacteroidota bacterium]